MSVMLLVFSIAFFVAAKSFSEQGKYVEVKGLSEKIVKADVAIWSMSFDVKSNDVDSLYAEIDRNTKAITSFLKQKGFEDSAKGLADKILKIAQFKLVKPIPKKKLTGKLLPKNFGKNKK